MIKITNKNETADISNIPDEVVAKAIEIAAILDDNYGSERDAEHDLGGYILVAETVEDVEAIREQADLEHNLPEYVDLITCSNGDSYTNSLMILSSDYSISLLIPLELTPKELLMHMEE